MNNSKKILKPLFKRYRGIYYKDFFRSKYVKQLSSEEIDEVKKLENISKIRDILRVYSSKNFNDKNGMSYEQKQQIRRVLISAKGYEQFHSGCEAFCNLDPNDFSYNFDLFIETIKEITSSEQDFQAFYASSIVSDCYIYGGENILKIVDFVVSLPDEEMAESAYNIMYEVGTNAYIEGSVPDVNEVISNFSKSGRNI